MEHGKKRDSRVTWRLFGNPREGRILTRFRKIHKVVSTDMTMKTRIQEGKRAVARSPTLQTVQMVEKFIDDSSGEFKKTELWRKLPRKVMWQTFQVIMSYLEGTSRVVYDRHGYVVYVWSPELYARIK